MTTMRRYVLLLSLSILVSYCTSYDVVRSLQHLPERSVSPGIDVLEETHFAILRGRRIGLITNHTGRNARGERTVDILAQAGRLYGFQLVRLFAPEHGLGGDQDARIASGTDPVTGLPMVSLYGERYAPGAEDLKGLDDLLFDIQDIGTRFYTYQATMALAMRAAAKHAVRFIVLDRPNPIGGLLVQGAVPPPERCGSLISIYPIPTRHGMTVGELAALYNEHFKINCELVVVLMRGWERWMLYDETGLPWEDPSPNMRSLPAAVFYPGLGTAETTVLSVGRGSRFPFEQYGAPFIDEKLLAARLALIPETGIRFLPVRFAARGHIHHGIRAVLIDRRNNDPILAGLYLIRTVMQHHPESFRATGGFPNEVGDPRILKRLENGETPETIIASWEPDLARFRLLRRRFLLY